MIIGFTGKIGAGKDTAGAYLVEKYGFERISFAAKLKESAAACFGINPEAWEHLKNNENAWVSVEIFDGPGSQGSTEVGAVTVREFLQNYGTEAHRDIFGQDFWVQQAIYNCSPTKNYVVTDVRFDNEAIAIKRKNGLVIQVNREDATEVTHSSEIGVSADLIDGKVANIGSIDQLHVLLDVLMERVLS